MNQINQGILLYQSKKVLTLLDIDCFITYNRKIIKGFLGFRMNYFMVWSKWERVIFYVTRKDKSLGEYWKQYFLRLFFCKKERKELNEQKLD